MYVDTYSPISRLRVYNQMLKDFAEPDSEKLCEKKVVRWFCEWLFWQARLLKVYRLPELYARMPRGALSSDYWWPINLSHDPSTGAVRPRVTALYAAMQEVAAKLSEKQLLRICEFSREDSALYQVCYPALLEIVKARNTAD